MVAVYFGGELDMKKQAFHKLALTLSVGLGFTTWPVCTVWAINTQIQTDNHLAVTPLVVDATPNASTYQILETNGQSAGGNLFYSFSHFNIGSGDTASFDLINSWDNVIARVTGGYETVIDGKLKVDVSAGGWASNFFLINPAGITFGAGSVVDVPGSFYASSANSLNFTDGRFFASDGTQSSQLSIEAPESFGFLGSEVGALNLNGNLAGHIKLDHATIQVFDDERIELVGRDISISNNSQVGMVNLVDAGYPTDHVDGIQMLLMATHTQTTGTVDLDGQFPTVKLDGDISLNSTSLLNAGGDAEEIQLVRGGNITLNHAHIISDNYGDDCGGCETSANNNNQEVPGSILRSGIDVLATGKLTLDNGSSIESETSFAPVGDVNIQADSLLIDHSSKITASSVDKSNISHDANGNSYLPDGTIPVPYAINPLAGDVNITVVNAVEVNHQSSILSSTETFGNAGHINITADSVKLDNTSNIKTESTANNGVLGYVLDADGRKADTTTEIKDPGDAGEIILKVGGNISIDHNSEISTKINSGVSDSQPGLIKFTGKTDGTSAGEVKISGLSKVTASSNGDANAGDIIVNASSLVLENASITTDSLGGELGDKTGNAGVIAVNSYDLTMNSGAYISSSTAGQGSAGSVSVTTGNLSIQGISAIPLELLGHYVDVNFTGIRSMARTGSGGQTGTIGITASNDVNLSNGAQISISNEGVGIGSLSRAGIDLNANSISLKNSQIVADSNHNVDAGYIKLNFLDKLYLDPSAISTSAFSGNGGAIAISGGNMVWLQNSAIMTSVLDPNGSGSGGNINLLANFLMMQSGFIQANTAAPGASGGLVNINTPFLIPSGSSLFVGGSAALGFMPFSGLNVIQAAAPGGVSGTVNVTSPQLNLSGTFASIAVQAIDPNALNQNMCAIGETSSLSQTGRGALPRRAEDGLLWNVVE